MKMMLKTPIVLVLITAVGATVFRSVHSPSPTPPTPPMSPTTSMKKLTPVLTVDAVEPAAAFWTERLGFRRTMEVPAEGGAGLQFAALEKDGVEIMYQTRASLAADQPKLAGDEYRTMLFIEVSDLDAVERALSGVEVVVPRRTTFYGMDELTVREPGGSIVVFAQPTGQEN